MPRGPQGARARRETSAARTDCDRRERSTGSRLNGPPHKGSTTAATDGPEVRECAPEMPRTRQEESAMAGRKRDSSKWALQAVTLAQRSIPGVTAGSPQARLSSRVSLN